MKDVNVLITGAGAPGAPGIIKSLRLATERNVRIIGVDMDPNSVGFAMVDKWHIGTTATSESFITRILEICREENVDVVIPLVTNELPKFAQNLAKFEKAGIKVLVTGQEGLKTANNKHLLMQSCIEQAIPTPEFYRVQSWSEFERAVYDLGYPEVSVCFKPPVSRGMRGFRILTNDLNALDLLMNHKPMDTLTDINTMRNTLESANPFPELLVMEYLPGNEYSIDLLADRGDVKLVVPRLREKMKMGISFVGITENNTEIIANSKKIAATLKLHGNIGLQFKLDRDGIPKIIECNPRVQGTIVLCTAAGVNMVYNAVKTALGEPISDKQSDIRWGIKMIRFWDEVYTDGNRFFNI